MILVVIETYVWDLGVLFLLGPTVLRSHIPVPLEEECRSTVGQDLDFTAWHQRQCPKF